MASRDFSRIDCKLVFHGTGSNNWHSRIGLKTDVQRMNGVGFSRFG
jgi:hypothetical protein